MQNRRVMIALLLGLVSCGGLFAQAPAAIVAPQSSLELAPLFGDHMVLPPQAQVVVHGSGTIEQEVEVRWAHLVDA